MTDSSEYARLAEQIAEKPSVNGLGRYERDLIYIALRFRSNATEEVIADVQTRHEDGVYRDLGLDNAARIIAALEGGKP